MHVVRGTLMAGNLEVMFAGKCETLMPKKHFFKLD